MMDDRRSPDKIQDLDLTFTDNLLLDFSISLEDSKDNNNEQSSTDKR